VRYIPHIPHFLVRGRGCTVFGCQRGRDTKANGPVMLVNRRQVSPKFLVLYVREEAKNSVANGLQNLMEQMGFI
jgi:hypothetical protein